MTTVLKQQQPYLALQIAYNKILLMPNIKAEDIIEISQSPVLKWDSSQKLFVLEDSSGMDMDRLRLISIPSNEIDSSLFGVISEESDSYMATLERMQDRIDELEEENDILKKAQQYKESSLD